MDSVLELLSEYTTEVVTAIVLSVVFFLLLRRYLAARRARQWTSAPPATVTFTPSAASGRAHLKDNSSPAAKAQEEAPPLPAKAASSALEVVPHTGPLPSLPAKNASVTTERPNNVANFGAYRIEQEVNKLAQGQSHRIEVLASRALDDRKAIEASLLRVMMAAGDDNETRERACRALEDYGFVARRCAEILLANEYYERATAARILGEIRSRDALPFLLEALYDGEEPVRLQAVTSLGELRLPSAIGALLDLARRHPEIPPTLLSNALNACSVESLSFFDMPAMDTGPAPLLLEGDDFLFDDEDELAATSDEDVMDGLPPGDRDEEILGILHHLDHAGGERQVELYASLGRHRSRLSVMTLADAAMNAPEPAVRAAAVSGLCEIDHPSGFAPILLAVGDESREVRAAAARSLSRLSFERSEAYAYLAQHEAPHNLVALAQACIKAGMAAQALDRLVSEDPRQAYESFNLLSLLVKAGEINPLLEAVAQHPNKEVRRNVLQLLVNTSQPEVVDYLRQVAIGDGIADDMRNALLETIYKIEDAGRRGRGDTILNDNYASRVA